ncbi:MAG: hypothetical protein PHH77_00610 [Victivallaceae bacterium]|nr:hypothetical protein [Victivallaceae bacterium]
MYKRFLLSAAAAAAMLIAGCEILDEAMTPKPKNRYVLSFHQIIKYPRAKDLEQKIVTFDGREIWINANQFFSSHNIEQVKLIPRRDKKDFYDLSLKLDYPGILKWIQLSMHFRNQPMALLIDGRFYEFYTPEHLTDENDEWVLLTGPFDKVTAQGIQKYARKNYITFNPNKQGFAEFFESLQE